MFNYPRTTMPPGYVFRIKNGERELQEVTVLKSGKPYDTGYAYLPTTYVTRKFTGSLFLKFLQLTPNDSTLAASANRSITIGISIGRGFIESIDEPTIDNLVKNSGINWKENNKYYIIQATLSSRSIHYKGEAGGGFNAYALLNLKKLDNGIRFSANKSDSTILNQDFDTSYRIYYRAVEINPMGASSSNMKLFTYKKVDIPIND